MSHAKHSNVKKFWVENRSGVYIGTFEADSAETARVMAAFKARDRGMPRHQPEDMRAYPLKGRAQ